MGKRRIRLDLAYDGTDFCGWQVQNNGRTVQAEIEKAIEKIEGKHVRITGSGRTDSGVHASFQTAHFDSTRMTLPPEKYFIALNSMLPGDVRILKSREVTDLFHSRFSARERGYKYYILPKGNASPFRRKYCWETRFRHNPALLNSYVSHLVGDHDFSSFAAAGDSNPSKFRVITSASFSMEEGFLVFSISGNAFLWKMVRSITGTVVALEKKGADPIRMKEILESRDRNQVGMTAPARALFLDYVRYSGEPGGTGFEYENYQVKAGSV